VKRLVPLALAAALGTALVPAGSAAAQPENPTEVTVEGRVATILEDGLSASGAPYQRLEVIITRGEGLGDAVVAEAGAFSTVNAPRYEVGDEVVLTGAPDDAGAVAWYVTDFVRRDALLALLALFVLVTVAVGRLYGITSLVGLVFSFLVVFGFVLPRILAGANPVTAAVLGSVAIVPVTFTLSHGFNRKTSVAIAGTVVALVVTGLLAAAFVSYAKLSGFADEQAAFLQVTTGGAVDVKGLLLAGIVISSLGVLDDVTVSQASVVRQLRLARRNLSTADLYWRAMAVGRDHIASAVNTLILVYAGASLPLLLMFVTGARPILEVVNYEFIAQEIVRTLVGCVGLVLAVPITTVLAAYLLHDEPVTNRGEGPSLDVDFDPHGHGHDHGHD
jgi:uncharacterized membrane protein